MTKLVKIRPRLYVESVGKRSCAMGWFGQGLEFWSWPVKLLGNFKASVWLPRTLETVRLEDFATDVLFKPESVTIRYAHPLFCIDETVFSPIDFPGCFVLYSVVSSVDLELIFHFKPELNLMWPGAIGGQYCHWSDQLNGFVISEPTDTFSAVIRVATAEKFSKEGDHAFAETLYSFKVRIEPGKKEFIVSVVGGIASKKACQDLLDAEKNVHNEMDAARKYYRSYLEETINLETPDKDLNEFFSWGKLSLLKGLIRNPNLGEALIAGIGPSGKSTRPGFAWFFAADASINSLAFCDYGDRETVRKSLEFYASHQSPEGRIPHEISQSHGLIDWFSNYKGFAFLHADTTAWFLLACAHYVARFGDTSFLKLMKDKILKACDFYDTVCDETGLIVNLKAGLGALEISEFRKPKYELYTNAIYLAALERLKNVFENVGENEICEKLNHKIQRIKDSIERSFWSEETKSYYLSVNNDGKLFDHLTPWPSFAISLRVLDPDRSKAFVERMCNSTVMTRWGARSIERCKHYDPINYNLGSVWHFINGFVAQSCYKTGHDLVGWQIIKSAVKAFLEEGSTHLSELFSGDIFVPVTTAVPHQLFSVGPILWAILEGLFGLEVDAIRRTLKFNPRVPVHWEKYVIKNLKVGKAELRIEFQKRGSECSYLFRNMSKEPVKVIFQLKNPPLGSILTKEEYSKSEDGLTFDFVLTDSKRIDYTLNGIDYSLEYENLHFGSCRWEPVRVEFSNGKHSSHIKFFNASGCVIHVFCPGMYSLVVEPDLPMQEIEEGLFQIKTDRVDELILTFIPK